jgi:hypothetical protein
MLKKWNSNLLKELTGQVFKNNFNGPVNVLDAEFFSLDVCAQCGIYAAQT